MSYRYLDIHNPRHALQESWKLVEKVKYNSVKAENSRHDPTRLREGSYDHSLIHDATSWNATGWLYIGVATKDE